MFLYSDTDFYLYSFFSPLSPSSWWNAISKSLLLSIGKSILEEKVESILRFVSVAATIWRFLRKTLNDSNIRLNASEKGFCYRIKVIDSIVSEWIRIPFYGKRNLCSLIFSYCIFHILCKLNFLSSWNYLYINLIILHRRKNIFI